MAQPHTPTTKISVNNNLNTVKIKTESNTLGLFKTLIILFLIVVQFLVLVLSYMYLTHVFQWIAIMAFVLSLITCIYVLSSNKNGQVKATWILFLLICSSFGFIIYFLSDERILFRKSKKKYQKIYKETEKFNEQSNIPKTATPDTANICNYLDAAGNFNCYQNSSLDYFSSGASLFDDILDSLKQAKHFVFIEYFIVSDGVLLNRMLDILKEKAQDGVDVRIIYDDMGSHNTLSRKTKKEIIRSGIKLRPFNKLVPMFNIALNLRNHRKIVVVDGNIAYTGGANLADEYINEKRMHGYWKDCGIKMQGECVNKFSLEFLRQWKFLTNTNEDFSQFLNKYIEFKNSSAVVPFVDGPNMNERIGKNAYISMMANAKEKIYIMTPYFIPDEAIITLLQTKAQSGVDVRIILPDIADKKFVYYVSRNTAERLISYGVKIYTMTKSFVHSKIVMNENSVIVGSINIDQRSFTQQFESAVFTDDKNVLNAVNVDFEKTIAVSTHITEDNKKNNNLIHRIIAGIFRIIAPFM